MIGVWFGHEPALRGLPITVRTMSDERAELHLRRLAHANHLEHSCLHSSPQAYLGSFAPTSSSREGLSRRKPGPDAATRSQSHRVGSS